MGLGPPRPPSFVREPPKPKGWQGFALLVFIVCLGVFGWMWLVSGHPVKVALVLIPLFMLLTAPLFARCARGEATFDLAGLAACGLLLRFLGSAYRMTHGADALTYHDAAAPMAVNFRRLNFSVDVGGSPIPGTGAMKIIAGVVETFTNSNITATFLVFTWLGFIGCYFFYRAFITAMPHGNRRRYALLVFLWPTLVFWPSSIGKDCWLLFALGIASLGAARVLVRCRGGYTLLVVGLVLGSFVRPHVVLLALAAFAFALLLSRRGTARPGTLTPASLAKIAGLVLLLVLGGYLASKTADLLNTGDFGAALTQNAARTDEGGSGFTAADPRNPLGYAESVVTVLFRPFPIEVHGIEQLGTSIEALFLAAMLAFSARRLVSIPRRLRAEPYVTYALVYLLMFFFAFGTVSNFGLLARERSQAMPLVFVLLSVSAAPIASARGERASLIAD